VIMNLVNVPACMASNCTDEDIEKAFEMQVETINDAFSQEGLSCTFTTGSASGAVAKAVAASLLPAALSLAALLA